MGFVVYYANVSGKIKLNITHNIAIDYAYYKSLQYDSHVRVLTPEMSISQAYYIMDDVSKKMKGIVRLLSGGNADIKMILRLTRLASASVGIKSYKKPYAVSAKGELPESYEENSVINFLNGKIMDFSSLMQKFKESRIFTGCEIQDILQTLYLKGYVKLLPSLYFEGFKGKLYCGTCGFEVLMGEKYCRSCGSPVDPNLPFYALPDSKSRTEAVKLKDAGYNASVENFSAVEKFSYPRAFQRGGEYLSPRYVSPAEQKVSEELRSFLYDIRHECLLWTVPGVKRTGILVQTINDVLKSGGRVLISSPCIKDISCFNSSSVQLCEFKDISGYFGSFDLVILYEPDGYVLLEAENFIMQSKRALKKDGRLIIAVSSPDYKTFDRVTSGESRLIALPVYKNGSICSEPRVMTYRRLNEDNIFIPQEAEEFIRWSNSCIEDTTIVVPEQALVYPVEQNLLRSGLYDVHIVTYPDIRNIKGNIIVFFAECKAIFNEKALLNISMLKNAAGNPESGETLFVGSYESDEMYNAKKMLRVFNKRAWEMGYRVL